VGGAIVVDVVLCCPVVSGSLKKRLWRAVSIFRNFLYHGHLLHKRLRALEGFTGLVYAFVIGC
jgi:hypothetical protein